MERLFHRFAYEMRKTSRRGEKMKTAITSLSLVFAFGIFISTSFADARSEGAPTKALPADQSLINKQRLNFKVGERGLDSLSFNGELLVVSPESGELQPQKSAFRGVLDAVLPLSSAGVGTPNKRLDAIDLSYLWGRISCAYGQQHDRLTMSIEVSNSSAKAVDEFWLRLMELKFPRIPNGGPLEAGMFGFGFKGPEWRLHEGPLSIPSIADPRFVVPIVSVDYGTGTLNFSSD